MVDGPTFVHVTFVPRATASVFAVKLKSAIRTWLVTMDDVPVALDVATAEAVVVPGGAADATVVEAALTEALSVGGADAAGFGATKGV